MIYEKTRRYIIPFDDVPAKRAEMPEISIEERKGNFVEVETGFPEEVAVQEAKRCLSCRRCLGCALCWAECKPEAINFSLPDETLELEFDEIIITAGQDNAFEPFSSDYGFGTYANVITDLQFERMLSPTGPTDGMVVSPLDGEIPAKIAIIQGAPEADDAHLLSSCILGINEAALALHKTEGLEVTLVSPLCEEFKKDFQKEAENISGLKILEAIPVRVEKPGEESALKLDYKAGDKEATEIFDMIVVLTKSKVAPDLKKLAGKLDQEVLTL